MELKAARGGAEWAPSVRMEGAARLRARCMAAGGGLVNFFYH